MKHFSYLLVVSLLINTLQLFACSDSADARQARKEQSEDNKEENRLLNFTSSDNNMERTFAWARRMALSYAHDGTDPVGYWYEAALPGRNAFCMRDVSHQTIGAEILGLSLHNFNMMQKFAENISEVKDWCTYWEIDKENQPCVADYVDDANFWYNLNANFDVIFACWRLYEWTGDRRYLEDSTLSRFYELSLNDYVQRWMLEPENLLKRPYGMNNKPETTGKYRSVRGLPSYVENYPGLTNSSDLIASMYGGFTAYSMMLRELGNTTAAEIYEARSEAYRSHLETEWWSDDVNTYHGLWTRDGNFSDDGMGLTYMLWFNAAQQPNRIRGTIEKMMSRTNWNIENVSHFPLLWYRYGYKEEAYDILRTVSGMNRSKYPEVSFGMIEGIVSGAMGICPSASQQKVATLPKLEQGTEYMKIDNLPVLQGYISVCHEGNRSTTFTNHTPQTLIWEAAFEGEADYIIVNGQRYETQTRTDVMGHKISFVEIRVETGKEARASLI